MVSTEFTPELTTDSLAALLNPGEEEERQRISNAKNEGAASGLVGQAAEGSRVGAIEAGAGRDRNSAIAGFNLDVADKQYGERRTSEQEAFQDTERQKEEAFRTQMMEMGYAHEDAMQAGAKHAAEQGEILGLVGGIGGAAIGGALGGPMGASMSAAAGKGLAGTTPSEEPTPMSGDEVDWHTMMMNGAGGGL